MLHVQVVRLPFFKSSHPNLYCCLSTVYSFIKRRNKPGFSGFIKIPIQYKQKWIYISTSTLKGKRLRVSGPGDRVFANGPGDRGSIRFNLKSSHTKDILKMALDTCLLNTQHHKVRIKGKVEQYRERSNALLYTSV